MPFILLQLRAELWLGIFQACFIQVVLPQQRAAMPFPSPRNPASQHILREAWHTGKLALAKLTSQKEKG